MAHFDHPYPTEDSKMFSLHVAATMFFYEPAVDREERIAPDFVADFADFVAFADVTGINL